MGIYQKIFAELKNGNKGLLLTTLGNSTQDKTGRIKKVYYTEAEINHSGLPDTLGPEMRKLIQQCFETGELGEASLLPGQKAILAEPYFPGPSLIIFGGGHIAKPLCEFSARLGFSVTVVDDRLFFANKERFPDASEVICEGFEKCFDRLQFNRYTYVVIVTRGHRYDTVCLREVAPKPWAYAGMIGSKRRVQGVIKQLIDEGIPAESMKNINTPIGLEIGAVTPEEIAISILGELISYRRLANPKLGRESARLGWTEIDRDVIEELSLGREDEKAIVTVISTKGSAPRRAGAKMLVWPDGRILGSIGGGCSEGAVIQTARDVIREGGYRIETVDLTGSMAEDEGMVCGGTMKVLIESFQPD